MAGVLVAVHREGDLAAAVDAVAGGASGLKTPGVGGAHWWPP
ncbi:hypothetical protein ACFFX0_21745 [Citricoccus parietis]|uniref:Uncharacterized protein n=1 Tax=Citricoccus parietis TaxID=592307 RepID=A0ABV5G417_9MICC